MVVRWLIQAKIYENYSSEWEIKARRVKVIESEPFEQQQEQYEEGKYNMNNLSPLNTFSYYI